MSFQRTLTRFSVRAMTPSASSWHGLRVQSRAYTLEFSPSATGPRRESLGRWSMNAAVAASPASRPNASTPTTTKMPMPARGAARIAALALAAALARVAGQRPVIEARARRRRLSGMRGPRERGGRGAQLAPRRSPPARPSVQRPRTSIVTVSDPTSRTTTSTSRRPASAARSRRAAEARSHSPAATPARTRTTSPPPRSVLFTIAFWASRAFGNSTDVPSSLRSRE